VTQHTHRQAAGMSTHTVTQHSRVYRSLINHNNNQSV